MSNNRKRARQRARVICLNRNRARWRKIWRDFTKACHTAGLLLSKALIKIQELVEKTCRLALDERENRED